MLALSNIHNLLGQVVELPVLHTVAVFTPAGQLVSYASGPRRPKDEVLLIVGLSGDVWQGTREQGCGMVDCELGRIVVLPVEDLERNPAEDKPPLMLVALTSTRDMDWSELQAKGNALVEVLASSWSKHREYLIQPKPVVPPPATTLTSKPLSR